MQSEGIKIDKHFCKSLGVYFMNGWGSYGSVVKGLINHLPGTKMVIKHINTSGIPVL